MTANEHSTEEQMIKLIETTFYRLDEEKNSHLAEHVALVTKVLNFLPVDQIKKAGYNTATDYFDYLFKKSQTVFKEDVILAT
jgi:hypothetical protein